MKVSSSVVLWLLVLNAEASFFDDFRGAMSSVESAFGKLMHDVVADVKTTMHCTVLAMQEVLAVNGLVAKPIKSKECYKDNDNINFDIDIEKNKRNLYSAKDIAQEIHSSISNVNKTLGHILDNSDHERIKHVKKHFKDETDRLAEVSLLLRKELEKISKRFKKELQGIDIDADKSSLESIWNNMKFLYEAEKRDKNISEEIGQVLNEALNVLHLNTVTNSKSDEEKIKVIMQKLTKESNNTIANNKINSELKQWNGVQSKFKNNLETKILTGKANCKDVADKVVKKVLRNTQKIEEKAVGQISKSGSIVNNLILNASKHSENKKSKSLNTNSIVTSPFGETNSEGDKKAIDEAMNILKDSAGTQALLDNLFATGNGVNVFDNANLLNM